MAQINAGSVDAFGEIYDRYCDRAYRLAVTVCREDGRAQDAVQEAFLAIWKSSASYRPQQGTLAAWLMTVVRHRAIDLARRNGHHDTRRASASHLEAQPSPEDIHQGTIAREDTERLRASLAQLPDTQREVITLAFYGQLTHTEIATELHLPTGTVKGRMRLGLQKLRTSLERTTA